MVPTLFFHLPGGRKDARAAGLYGELLYRIWRRKVCARLLAYIARPTKRLLWRKLNDSRERARASRSLRRAESQCDVLLVDNEPAALSRLASMLTSRGMLVMCTVDPAEALSAAKSTHPQVLVMSNMPKDHEVVREIESFCVQGDTAGQPLLITLHRDANRVDSAQRDQLFLDPRETGELVATVIRRVRSSEIDGCHSTER